MTDASAPSTRPSSVGRLFLNRVAATPELRALMYPQGEGWGEYSWAQTGDKCSALAAGLLSLGIKPEERVGIASGTCVEWILADLAIMCSGAATTTVYPSTPTEDVGYILGDSGTRIVFVENAALAAKVAANRAALPDLTDVVLMTGSGVEGTITLDELEAKGREYLAAHPTAVEDAVSAVTLTSLATLIYTSGTTGRPKGVRLTHENWVYEGEAMDAVGVLTSDDVQFLWLPLAHSFGKVLVSGMLQVGFSTAVDGRVPRIVPNLKSVQPTFMAAVPRIFEKVYGAVSAQATAPGAKGKIASWAFKTGVDVASKRQNGEQPSAALMAQYKLADKLVFQKVRDGFGGKVRYFVSGSAALSRDIALFFDAAGLPILEGYGLTETSAFTFISRPDTYKFGTVGEAAPGTEVKIAADGEILVRGPGVMLGYHNMPEETASVFDDEGWFLTGDIGQLEGALLRITDRKKDLIKTSGGKYVAPQGIEIAFKAVCPYASQIVVHGDSRNYCTALVTLDPESIHSWGDKNGFEGKTYEEIAKSSEAKAMIEGYVEEMNKGLPRWETIKKVAILPHDLTIEDGDLTPSLKVKRKVVEKKYMHVLDALYAES